MPNEIEAGRAAMPDRDAEISQEAARAMLAALKEAADELWDAAHSSGDPDDPQNMQSDAATYRTCKAAIALAERGA